MLRCINGVTALMLIVMFLIHAGMGAFFVNGLVFGEVRWIAWVGIGIIALHGLLSIGTTWRMFNDRMRPPSAKKKEHQIKKWITGIIIGVITIAHVLVPFGTATWVFVALLLDGAGIVHICISSKSLVKDIKFPPQGKYVVRAVTILIAVLAGLGVGGLLMR